MFKALLLPTDGSPLSEQAVRQGVALAKALDARVVGLHVTLPFHVLATAPIILASSAEQYDHDVAEAARKYLATVETEAKNAGVAYYCLTRSSDHPYEEIIEVARQMHCDAICMASHGRRGMSAMVLGSETNKVLTHSKIPVMVFR